MRLQERIFPAIPALVQAAVRVERQAAAPVVLLAADPLRVVAPPVAVHDQRSVYPVSVARRDRPASHRHPLAVLQVVQTLLAEPVEKAAPPAAVQLMKAFSVDRAVVLAVRRVDRPVRVAAHPAPVGPLVQQAAKRELLVVRPEQREALRVAVVEAVQKLAIRVAASRVAAEIAAVSVATHPVTSAEVLAVPVQ